MFRTTLIISEYQIHLKIQPFRMGASLKRSLGMLTFLSACFSKVYRQEKPNVSQRIS